MIQRAIVFLLLAVIVAAQDPCLDGTYKEGDYFSAGECDKNFYRCVNGQQQSQGNCPTGTVFDRTFLVCNHISEVPACLSVDSVDCSDPSYDAFSYTKPDDCNSGAYYTCTAGKEIQSSCPSGLVFNTIHRQCFWAGTFDCVQTSIPSDTRDPTPPEESTSTATDPVDPGATELSSSTTAIAATEISSTSTTTTTTGPDTHESTPPAVPTTISTSTSTSTTVTTGVTTRTTEPEEPRRTYVGFVVDDTGSMSNEIVAVKEWISNCVSGGNPACGQSPTGGWIVTSFNDPNVGRVLGPTLDTAAIIAEVGNYRARGGGDCPEKGFTGLQNAATVVPDVNSGCKIYFFTDATAIDDEKHASVTALYKEKGCAFIPILTGCCGTCPDACESTSPEYCENHIYDSRTPTSYRIAKRATYDNIQTLFYLMSEHTGGNIYVTDKPSSPDDMSDFLEEEITMGFCSTSDIAGPKPGGYGCKEDCEAKGMCWEKGVDTCYCNSTIACPDEPIEAGDSKCPGKQLVVCENNVPTRVERDQEDCRKFFQCSNGLKYHFTCAEGTVYSKNSSSHCDHPYNVAPPCGTQDVEL